MSDIVGMAITDEWRVIELLAAELGKSSEARRKARERGRVPYPWRVPLLELARSKRIKLRPESFDAVSA